MIWHQEPCQDSTCPPILFLESRRSWTSLMDLEMVSYGREHPSKVSVKVSSKSDIRNHVKTPPVLQVFSWSLGGHWYSWWTWIWCQMGANIHQKLLWKFHQDPTCFDCFRVDFELGLGWGGGGGLNLVKPWAKQMYQNLHFLGLIFPPPLLIFDRIFTYAKLLN